MSLNCIYCHNETTQLSLQIYECYPCKASFITFNEEITFINITYNVDSIWYDARIYPTRNYINYHYHLADLSICTQPINWMFPQLIPDVLYRLNKLAVFT